MVNSFFFRPPYGNVNWKYSFFSNGETHLHVKWISFLGGNWTASLDYQRVTKQKALQSNSYICNWLQNKKQQIQNSINMSSMVIMHTNDIQYIVYTSYAYPMYNSAIWLHQSPSPASHHPAFTTTPRCHASLRCVVSETTALRAKVQEVWHFPCMQPWILGGIWCHWNIQQS